VPLYIITFTKVDRFSFFNCRILHEICNSIHVTGMKPNLLTETRLPQSKADHFRMHFTHVTLTLTR